MKAERDSGNERIWAYLHGEGDTETRRIFEQEVACDDALRAELDCARKFDSALRIAMPSLSVEGADEEALVAQTLAAWERQGASAERSGPVSRQRLMPFLPAFRRLAVGLSSVAAAAALAVVLTHNLRPPQQAKWEAPAFVPLVWRGPDTQTGGGAMDARAAQRCREALMASVSRVAAARGVALLPGLVFSLRVQELRGGVFSVCARARSFAGRDVGEWSGTYSGIESFLKHADASAGRIVEDVTAHSGGDKGDRP